MMGMCVVISDVLFVSSSLLILCVCACQRISISVLRARVRTMKRAFQRIRVAHRMLSLADHAVAARARARIWPRVRLTAHDHPP